MKIESVFNKVYEDEYGVLGFVERFFLLSYVKFGSEDLEGIRGVLEEMKGSGNCDVNLFLELIKAKGTFSDEIVETLGLFEGGKKYGWFCCEDEVPEKMDETGESLFEYYRENFGESWMA